MPKVKTNPGAKKRFSLTGSGKIKRKHASKATFLPRSQQNVRGILLMTVW